MISALSGISVATKGDRVPGRMPPWGGTWRAREPGAGPRRLTGMTSGSRTVLDSGHDGAVPLYLPLLRALPVTW
jgi:hypothetical protein